MCQFERGDWSDEDFRKISAVVVKNTSGFSVEGKPFLWRPIRGRISQNFGRRRQQHLKL